MKKAIKIELARIDKKAGKILKPQTVVDYARNPKTALHNCFEWNNTKAANEYRLEQARRLIRVYIDESPAFGQARRIRVSLKRDRIEKGGGYRLLNDVLSDEQLYKEFERQCYEELIYIKDKYNEIKKYKKVWDAIDKAG